MLCDDSQLNSAMNNFKRESTVKKSASDHKPGTDSSKGTMTFLVCILQILQAFFRTAFLDDISGRRDLITLEFSSSSSLNAALVLRGFSYSLLPSQLDLNVTSSPEKISNTAIMSLCNFFAKLWSNISISESIVTNESILKLTEICQVLSQLHAGINSLTFPSFLSFLEKAFENFPYVSKEFTVAVPGSSLALSSERLAQSLNLYLTELILLTSQSSTKEYVSGTVYLSDCLDAQVGSMQSSTIASPTSAHLERTIKAWGIVFKKSYSITPSVTATLNLFQRLADCCITSSAVNNDSMLRNIYSCTCEFVEILSANSTDVTQSTDVYSSVLKIFSTLPKSWKSIPGEPGFHSRKVISSFLVMLRRFPCEEESLIGLCSESFRGLLDREGIFDCCTGDIRTLTMELLAFVPNETYVACVHRFAIILAQRKVTCSEIEYFFNVVYLR